MYIKNAKWRGKNEGGLALRLTLPSFGNKYSDLNVLIAACFPFFSLAYCLDGCPVDRDVWNIQWFSTDPGTKQMQPCGAELNAGELT